MTSKVTVTKKMSALVQAVKPTIGALALVLGELMAKGAPNTAYISVLQQRGSADSLLTIAAQWDEVQP